MNLILLPSHGQVMCHRNSGVAQVHCNHVITLIKLVMYMYSYIEDPE